MSGKRFYSKLVRLKAWIGKTGASRKEYGFYSKLVRLKDARTRTHTHAHARMFLFQTGSIKRQGFRQFRLRRSSKFLFQTGSIKRAFQIALMRVTTPGFYSKLVRLKVKSVDC